MGRFRIIPVLLLKKGGLYKSIKFRDHKYVGDPINAVKIFNEKEVDEIIILDIEASAEKRPPDIRRVKELTGEAFMPLAYGGGITSTDQVKNILYEGVEKVVFNTCTIINPKVVEDTAKHFGSSSVIVSIDVKKNWIGKTGVYTNNGKTPTGFDVIEFARQAERLGAGEIFLNSIDKDGTYSGYDIELIEKVSNALSIPLIVCGGASSVEDFKLAINSGASAVAAGSMFVFQRPHNAVLISYPKQEDLLDIFN